MKNFSKNLIISIIVLNVLFSIGAMIVFAITGNEPVALISAWFLFTTGELWQLATIKKHKINQGTKEI